MPSNSSARASDPPRVVCLLTGRGVFPELENKTAAAVAQTPRQRRGGGTRLPLWRHHMQPIQLSSSHTNAPGGARHWSPLQNPTFLSIPRPRSSSLGAKSLSP
ncbi:hypothetical protein MRX96_046932 [Rhipicephalus microplus]